MSNLSFFTHDYNGAEVRVTEDRRFSVFDTLVALEVANSKDVRMVLKRIMAANPEVVTACDYFKFPGRGQRETPVATEEVLCQILMLAPGDRAAAFREWAAGIIVDPEKALDQSVRNFRKEGRSWEWIEARMRGKVARHKLTDCLKAHGVVGAGYAICTDEINKGLHGKTAKQLRAEKGLAKSEPLRDSFSEVENAANFLAEVMAGKNIETNNAWGNDQCADECRDAARRVRRVFD